MKRGNVVVCGAQMHSLAREDNPHYVITMERGNVVACGAMLSTVAIRSR